MRTRTHVALGTALILLGTSAPRPAAATQESGGPTMLQEAPLIAFISTARPREARAFYVDLLGLELEAEEPGALVLQGGGRLLRMQIVDEMPPSRGAVLGWEVRDIGAVVRALAARGIEVQRYEGLPQDGEGIATFPNGDRVAWFLDPDGNVLSVSQLVGRD